MKLLRCAAFLIVGCFLNVWANTISSTKQSNGETYDCRNITGQPINDGKSCRGPSLYLRLLGPLDKPLPLLQSMQHEVHVAVICSVSPWIRGSAPRRSLDMLLPVDTDPQVIIRRGHKPKKD
uniref:Putative secreted protein n=1 Tax=Amblyomma americanum TaxID=6943 RepID=A0A0C9S444_AMBAM